MAKKEKKKEKKEAKRLQKQKDADKRKAQEEKEAERARAKAEKALAMENARAVKASQKLAASVEKSLEKVINEMEQAMLLPGVHFVPQNLVNELKSSVTELQSIKVRAGSHAQGLLPEFTTPPNMLGRIEKAKKHTVVFTMHVKNYVAQHSQM